MKNLIFSCFLVASVTSQNPTSHFEIRGFQDQQEQSSNFGSGARSINSNQPTSQNTFVSSQQQTSDQSQGNGFRPSSRSGSRFQTSQRGQQVISQQQRQASRFQNDGQNQFQSVDQQQPIQSDPQRPASIQRTQSQQRPISSLGQSQQRFSSQVQSQQRPTSSQGQTQQRFNSQGQSQQRPTTSQVQSQQRQTSQGQQKANSQAQQRPTSQAEQRPTSQAQQRPTSQAQQRLTSSQVQTQQRQTSQAQQRPTSSQVQTQQRQTSQVQSQQRPTSSQAQSSSSSGSSSQVTSTTSKPKTESEVAAAAGRLLSLPDPELCKNRPKQWQFNGQNYYFSWDQNDIDPETKEPRKVDWLEARNQCRRRCMDSIGIETEAENNMVVKFLNDRKIRYIWTSGRLCDFTGCAQRKDLHPISVLGWFWSDTNTKTAPTNEIPPGWLDQPWSIKGHVGGPQPDNAEFDINRTPESCLAVLNNIYKDGIKWHDIACYHKKPYICEDSKLLLNYIENTNPGIKL